MLCSLCRLPLPNNPVTLEEFSFCCHGCQAVYQILSSQNALADFEKHPLFKQAVSAGLISNPDLLDQIRKKALSTVEKKKVSFEIDGMWCPSCAEVIRWILLQERGVCSVIVDYATDLGCLEYCPRTTSKKALFEKISSLGYKAYTFEDPLRKKRSTLLNLQLIVALFCTLNVMMFSYPVYASYFSSADFQINTLFSYLAFFASLPVLFFSGWPIWTRGLRAAKVGILGMEALVFIGVAAAFSLSTYQLYFGNGHIYFDSMCVIISLVLIGKWIESIVKRTTKEKMYFLSRSLPRRARKINSKYVPLKEVAVEDEILVYAGEKIPLDGEVIQGKGLVDESSMTGEVIPILKENKSSVIAGTLLKQGRLHLKISKTLETSTLTAILRSIELQFENKTQKRSPLDQLLQWFVPSVVIIAILTGFVSGNIINVISVLLIACPCAIGIATPLVESRWLREMAKQGALIRNREIFHSMPKITTFIFDKTGTVTEGRYCVIEGLESLTSQEKNFLKALSSQSIHPISTAINMELTTIQAPMKEINEYIGKGIRGETDGLHFRLGSKKYLESEGVSIPHITRPSQIGSTVYFSCNKKLISSISLGDQVRRGVNVLLKQLQPYQKILLSGDQEAAVQAVAAQCGFDAYEAEKNPLEKRTVIESLQKKGKSVCFVGDGINDALALATAHVGISVSSASDVSIQTSDLLLTTDGLNTLPQLLNLTRKANQIANQNLFWAFAYNFIGIGLAAFGCLTPIYAASAMVLSGLIILGNTHRRYTKTSSRFDFKKTSRFFIK